MHKQARISRLIVRGFLALSLAGCTAGPQSTSPQSGTALPASSAPTGAQTNASVGEILIGVGVPLSGARAAFGTDIVTGTKIAVADINSQGGLLGHQLRVVTADDACGMASAEAAAKRLVADNISLAIGHFCSSSTHTAAGIYAARNIVEITPASTATAVTEYASLRHWTTLFRTVDNDGAGGDFAAAYFARKYAGQPIGFLHADDEYSVTIAKAFRAGMQKNGGAPAVDGAFTADGGGFDALVSALEQARVKAIFIAGDAAASGFAVWSLRQAGITANLYGTFDMADTRFGDIAGSAADGVRFSDRRISVDTALAPGLAGAYAGEGANGHGYVATAYAAVQAWAAAVMRAKSFDGITVAAALRQAPVDTAIGRLSWDAKGDLKTSLQGWYLWQGGTYQVDKVE